MCNERVEVEYKDKKKIFEENSVIYWPIMSIHLDSDYYEDPLKFNLDRFAPE